MLFRSVQFAALTALARRPGVSQAYIGEELDLDRSTIADLIHRMMKRGLVEREQSTEDRRRKVLTLTDAGEQTLAELRPRVDRVEQLLMEGFTPTVGDALKGAVLTMLGHGVNLGVLRTAATPTNE